MVSRLALYKIREPRSLHHHLRCLKLGLYSDRLDVKSKILVRSVAIRQTHIQDNVFIVSWPGLLAPFTSRVFSRKDLLQMAAESCARIEIATVAKDNHVKLLRQQPPSALRQIRQRTEPPIMFEEAEWIQVQKPRTIMRYAAPL